MPKLLFTHQPPRYNGFMRNVLLLMLLAAIPACDRGGPVGLPMGEYPVRPRKVDSFRFDPDVVLLITGGNRGRLEMCNCSGVLPGGMARRGGMLASYRAVWPDSITLDVGDLFWVEPDPVRSRSLIRAMTLLGYDVLALGDAEWTTPAKHWADALTGDSPALLATNVRFRDARTSVVKTVRRAVGGCDVAIVSYVGPDAFLFADDKVLAGLQRDGEDVFKRHVASLPAGCVVVAVVHDSAETAERIARTTPGVDVVVRGHTGKTDAEVARVGDVPIVRIGGPAHAGALALRSEGGRITDVQWRAELLTNDWPADRRLMELYQAYVHAAMRQAMNAKRKAGLTYVPSATCGACHRDQYRQWKRTAHADAYRTLRKVKRTGDPNCLMCHTSGFGTRDGFHTIAANPKLAGVNCQDCHRFNVSEHVTADGRQIAAFKVPPADGAVCETCHTPNNSPKFDHKRYAGKILSRSHGLR